MAQSRTERIGTIFTRIKSLVKGNAMQKENVPLWYDIYKAFPPKTEPRFNRPASQREIPNILYKEDHLRIKVQKDISLPPFNLLNTKPTATQIFFTIRESLLQNGATEEEAYTKSLETYKTIFIKPSVNDPNTSNMASHESLNEEKNTTEA